MESGKDPRDLLGSLAGVRRQPKEDETGHGVRKIVVSVDGAKDFGQPKFEDVFQLEVEEQKVTSVPGRNLGRRLEDIVYATDDNNLERVVPESYNCSFDF